LALALASVRAKSKPSTADQGKAVLDFVPEFPLNH
jgi:hypothetical protein